MNHHCSFEPVVSWLIPLAALSCVAFFLTGGWRAISSKYAIFDIPNPRSSHKSPTPRGAGVAIFGAFLLWLGLLYYWKHIQPGLFVSLLVGGSAIGLVGLLDDLRPVSAASRLIVHVSAALFAGLIIGAPMVFDALEWPAFALLLTVVGIVWHTNLFNFMDGIDGIAATQAITVMGGAVLISVHNGTYDHALLYLGLITSCLGFLAWNWPPAKVFMGDSGSGFLGYTIAVIALYSTNVGYLSLWTWIILTSLFVVDSTITIIRRFLRGQRVHEAHRTHAYQILSRRTGSHAKVTVGLAAINLLWVLPVAFASVLYENLAPILTVVALSPIVVLVLASGAGTDGRVR